VAVYKDHTPPLPDKSFLFSTLPGLAPPTLPLSAQVCTFGDRLFPHPLPRFRLEEGAAEIGSCRSPGILSLAIAEVQETRECAPGSPAL